jgi:Periplasmic binding protein domain
VVDVVHHDPHHHHRDLDRHHHNRSARRTVVDPEPGRQLPEWLSRLGQLLRAIGRCAHTRDPVREAAQRSMPMGLARVRHSVLAQRALIRSASIRSLFDQINQNRSWLMVRVSIATAGPVSSVGTNTSWYRRWDPVSYVVSMIHVTVRMSRVKAPSGFEVVMNTNHHLSKPVMIGKINSSGTFDIIWQSINPVRADAWSKYLPDSAKRTADWTFPWVCGGCTEPTFKDW